jgi:monofunctional biosynthetic peptidoglycan transglycosylase
MKPTPATLLRLLGLVVLSLVALQLYFLARVALMTVVAPQSTTFQRSEAWRLLSERGRILWSQQWVDYERISPHLKRAVIASEDARFNDHSGIEWDAIEAALEKNQREEAKAEKRAEREAQRHTARPGSSTRPLPPPRIVGGSTITQQLAKNLFLGSERSFARKAQEAAITLMLEGVLSKQRILEIYLNNVEWGEGLFGAEAAARHYYRVSAAQVGVSQAARMAVMLPAPKRFEKRPYSAYMSTRAGTVAARMGGVELP